jgi:thiamine-phosphate pyrophosphorylase
MPPRPPPLPAGLYGVCDDTARPDLPLPAQARLLLEGGVRVLQLRMKRTPTRPAVAVVREVSRLAAEAGAFCLVNDRVDWALVGGAHGVHLGDEDLPVEDARALLGPGALIGATARGAEGAARARAQGADYVGMGPLFATRTKVVEAPVMGLARLAEEVARAPLPVVAIGGITLAQMEEVGRSGAHGAAVVSDVLCQADVPARARLLQAAFDRGARGRSLPTS